MINKSQEINDLMAMYYDKKITRIELEEILKEIGIDSLIKFIIEEV